MQDNKNECKILMEKKNNDNNDDSPKMNFSNSLSINR